MGSQHGKPSSYSFRSAGAHRKIKPRRKRRPGRIAAALISSLVAAAGIAQLTTHGSWITGQSAAIGHAASAGPEHPPASPAPSKTRPETPAPSKTRPRTRPAYENPLRAVTGLIPERIDMGVDFGGSGPVYALGNAVITSATADDAGWPGGGWITYRLSNGPAKGLQVYVAENVTPAVTVGEHVTPGTVIAHMYNGGDGIETGWAMPDGLSAESQLGVAGGISGGGPFPTEVGLNFDALLQALGVRPAPNFSPGGYGTLPSFYPRSWLSVRVRR